jgi:hypothetical protein
MKRIRPVLKVFDIKGYWPDYPSYLMEKERRRQHWR